jgi:[acyl-carrier-protein] S-malonyltransferase
MRSEKEEEQQHYHHKNHTLREHIEEAALAVISAKGLTFLDEDSKRLRMVDVLSLVDELERRFFPPSLSPVSDDLLFFRPPTLPELINTLSQCLELSSSPSSFSPSSLYPSSPLIRSTSKRKVKKAVLLFPGQGAQKVGMAKGVSEHPKALSLFEKAKEVLGYDLLSICLNGPEDLLSSTEISQPALFVTSLAALEKWKEEIEGDLETETEVVGYAGLSLGEYTAITASGMLSFEEGLKLVQIRGKAMQRACNSTLGGMVSVLGYRDTLEVEGLLRKVKEDNGEKDTLHIACVLCPGNTVVSGSSNLLGRLDSLVKLDAEDGARVKTVRLSVAGAFHTSAMGEALPSLREAIGQTDFTSPMGSAVVASNSNGRLTRDSEAVKKNLLTQLCQPVLWQQVVESLITFVNSPTTSQNGSTLSSSSILEKGEIEFVELGTSAAVVTGLVRRILTANSVQNVTVRLVAM